MKQKTLYFTPGPSELWPTLPKLMEAALSEGVMSLSHRTKFFEDLFAETRGNLRALLKVPENYHIVFLGSATESWERIIENLVLSKSFHFVSGEFGKRFYNFSNLLKRTAVINETAPGVGFFPTKVDIPKDIELIALTLSETSTGAWIPESEFPKLRALYPEAMIAVDVVSAVPYTRLSYESVDCAFFSVQKGFGLPAGLGVLILSERAVARAKELERRGRATGTYHRFTSLASHEALNQTPETPNVLGIYLLSKVACEMGRYGIDKIRAETDKKSALIGEAVNAKKEALSYFVKDKEFRAPTVHTIECGVELKGKLAKNGILVGSGYGEFKERQIRVANFPSHSLESVTTLCEALRNLS